MAKSPSITTREIDASTYTTTSSNTTLAIVGFATKGPVGRAQMVTSKSEFIEIYGSIPEKSPYGHLAAYRAFNQTNKIIYYRVASGDVSAERVILNTVGASGAYREFASNEPSLYLETGVYGFKLKIGEGSEEEVKITVTLANEGWFTLSEVVSELSSITGATISVVNNKVRVTANSGGGIVITDLASPGISLLGEEYLGTIGDEVPAVEAKTVGETDTILLKAKETGSSTNNITLVKTKVANPIVSGEFFHNFSVLYNGAQVEEFKNLSLDPLSKDYFLSIITRDPSNGGSNWIEVDVERGSGASGDVSFPDGNYKLGKGSDLFSEGDSWETGSYDYREGTDGIPEGSSNSLFIQALSSDSDLANSEKFDFDILITPGNGLTSVQNAAIELAESKQDFIYIADTPSSLTYTQVNSWHNGNGHGRNAALNSSYAATYWSWLKEYNTESKEYTWVPPSTFIAELYLKTDNNSHPWAAPAGEKRGKLITSDIEHSPSFAEREVIYGDLNAINPIIELGSKGIMVYGQKTTLRENSAVNRVNIRRMLIYVKKLIKRSVEGLIFDPHTPTSWSKASSSVSSILELVKSQGGIEDYLVSINAATNTPNLIAQGIMSGNIVIVPTGTIERIELGIKFLSPGAIITE